MKYYIIILLLLSVPVFYFSFCNNLVKSLLKIDFTNTEILSLKINNSLNN